MSLEPVAAPEHSNALRHHKIRLRPGRTMGALYNEPAHPDEQLNAMTIDASGNVYSNGGERDKQHPLRVHYDKV